jgi:hypothetical protein|tara:strand:- start:122 stop:595 length:474 start_codon:yes stop_codon:yes gene_type:complete
MSKKKPNQLKKIGRPQIVIDEDLCKKAETLAAQGLIMEQIANVLGMSETTLYDKKDKFSEFSQAIKRGKDKGIATVTSALFTKARAGDNTAMIFYLKNRAGWQDKIEKETIIEQKQIIDLTRITDDELGRLKQVLTKASTTSGSRGDEKVIEGVYEK